MDNLETKMALYNEQVINEIFGAHFNLTEKKEEDKQEWSRDWFCEMGEVE